jgi:4-amino-4-deoxy-L-arabinose transferase-like glycosyltransferase
VRLAPDGTGRVAALVAVAFAVRLGWGLAAGVTPGELDDAAWYHATATALARGSGYVSPFTFHPTAAWPPGYPLLLSLAYRAAGAVPATAVVVNAAFGALTCVLVWRLGLRLAGSTAAAVATALLAAFPSSILFSALVLSETVFTGLVLGLMLVAVRLVDDREEHALAWLGWGVGAGAAALVRAEAVLLALVPAAALVTLGRGRVAPRIAVAALLGLAITLAPWTIRNARVFGAFVPTSTGFGRTLWIGHNPDAEGGMSRIIQLRMTEAIAAANLPPTPEGEIATDRLLRRQAFDFMRSHPLRELALTPARMYHLFRGDHVWQEWYGPGTPRVLPSPAARRTLGVAGNVYYLLVGCLALAGLRLRGGSAAAGWRVVDVWMLTWIAIFTAIYGDPRFHQVLLPPACILAAVTIARLTGGRDPHDGATSAP